jgi:Flp pilus assembly protein TadD
MRLEAKLPSQSSPEEVNMSHRLRQGLSGHVSRIAVLAAAMALGGCGGPGLLGGSQAPEAPQLVRPDPNDTASKAAYWGAKYEADRNNIDAALQFARSLRQIGGATQAVQLLKDVVMRAPDNTGILSEYGKALTEAGRPADALPFFSRALQGGLRDWTLHSAYGVALDQTGNHRQAQAQYESAMKMSPDNLIVQGNLAMSFVLEGNLVQGEEILRELVARPDATPQIRQNMSMVASLRGNRKEAENLARQDLSPAETKNNLAVMEQLSAANAMPLVPAAPPTQAPAITQDAAKGTTQANLATGPEDTILPLVKPKDTSVLPLPARIVAETPRPQDEPQEATEVASKLAEPATTTLAVRRPIRTMQPIADEIPGAAIAARNEAPATPATAAPTVLRRSLAADEPGQTGNLSIATSDF